MPLPPFTSFFTSFRNLFCLHPSLIPRHFLLPISSRLFSFPLQSLLFFTVVSYMLGVPPLSLPLHPSVLHLSQRRINSAVESRPLLYSLAIICCSLILSFNLLPSFNTLPSSASHISCCSAHKMRPYRVDKHTNSFHIEL